MGDRERKMGLDELMGKLGDAHPGSAARPPLEAEYERRKFIWQVIALVGVVIAAIGVTIAGLHLR
jgi:hypothetical protein